MEWIDTGRVALRYELTGAGDTTLVLMHEMGGCLESWDYLLPLLPAGLRVLRYDMRGAGVSELPPEPMTMPAHTADLAALLDVLAIKAPIVPMGTAVGGAAALFFAATYPGRTRAVIATSPAIGVPEDRRAGLRARADLATSDGFRSTVDAGLDRGYPALLRADAARFTRTRGQRLSANRLGFAATMRMLADLDMTAELNSITCPTLVIAGQHDGDRPPENVAATVALIPGAETLTLPSGHFMAIQTPELVANAIAPFLARI
ncbi:alpha/beta fold hydrolase [Acidisphaera sp. L21]|uniref:alpha/beta fold hydrolase n=1 Tax=Acidisphaera sp. L21 TaxID=1641851 RepID=UPI00131A644B|nr:alpha/beta fold hydrolase [Acidisphaera sp. L21]